MPCLHLHNDAASRKCKALFILSRLAAITAQESQEVDAGCADYEDYYTFDNEGD
jgi:hypothetical protein